MMCGDGMFRKLILIDSDQTLRRNDGTISENTKNIIKKLTDNNYYVVICTGRPRYHTKKIKEVAAFSPIIISSNGAEIYDTDNDKIIDSSYIDKDECYKLIDYAVKHNLRLIVSVGDIEYVTKDVRNENQVLFDLKNYKNQLVDKDIYQCMIIDSNILEVEKIRKLVLSNGNLMIKNELAINTNSEIDWFAVGNPDATKGSALVKLAEYLDIPINDTISIGNDYNDISMFEEAGFSVCVANGEEEVKKYADYITLSNDEDGVAIILEKILNNNIEI